MVQARASKCTLSVIVIPDRIVSHSYVWLANFSPCGKCAAAINPEIRVAKTVNTGVILPARRDPETAIMAQITAATRGASGSSHSGRALKGAITCALSFQCVCAVYFDRSKVPIQVEHNGKANGRICCRNGESNKHEYLWFHRGGV